MCRVLENEKLVVTIVNKYFKKYVRKGRLNQSYGDLIQTGMFGLVKADNTFKEENGVKFSTYAWRVVYNSLMTYVRREILGEQGTFLAQDVNISLESHVKAKYNEKITLADVIESNDDINFFKMDLEIFLSKLPNVQRERFTKKFLEGKFEGEIAEEEGSSRQAIGQTCRLVKKKLKKEFKNYI